MSICLTQSSLENLLLDAGFVYYSTTNTRTHLCKGDLQVAIVYKTGSTGSYDIEISGMYEEYNGYHSYGVCDYNVNVMAAWLALIHTQHPVLVDFFHANSPSPQYHHPDVNGNSLCYAYQVSHPELVGCNGWVLYTLEEQPMAVFFETEADVDKYCIEMFS